MFWVKNEREKVVNAKAPRTDDFPLLGIFPLHAKSSSTDSGRSQSSATTADLSVYIRLLTCMYKKDRIGSGCKTHTKTKINENTFTRKKIYKGKP